MSFADRASSPGVTAAGPPGEELDDASDDELMTCIAVGDEAAFQTLARRHVARSLAVAQRVVGNASDAEEIVQDALLRVWQHAADWRTANAKVATWLYRIVVNLAIDRLRKRRFSFVPIDDAGDLADGGPDAQVLVEGRQLEAFMTREIAALPPRQRAALTLCYSDGMDCAEAARIMQISVSAMESLLVRGRRTLRARLDEFTMDPITPNKKEASFIEICFNRSSTTHGFSIYPASVSFS